VFSMKLNSPRLELLHVRKRDVIKEALGAGPEHDHLLLDWHWRILRLLEQLSQFPAAIELLLGGLIEVGTELRESRQIPVLAPDQGARCRQPASSLWSAPNRRRG